MGCTAPIWPCRPSNVQPPSHVSITEFYHAAARLLLLLLALLLLALLLLALLLLLIQLPLLLQMRWKAHSPDRTAKC